MVKKGVAKIINTENNKVYIISSCKKNIDDHIEGVMSELENGCRNNPKLQNDYNNNPEAFKSEIIHIRYGEEDNQELNNEINRLQAEEVYKYKDNKYNRRTGNVSYEGGNTNPFTRKGLNENEFVMTDFMERLFASLNKYNLSQESKNIIKEKIDNGNITSEFELIRAIREQEKIEKLLVILNQSNLKSKDKNKLAESVKRGVISSEHKLETEIDSILNTYKSNSKPKKTQNKNNSLKNKKPKNTFQDKISSNYIKLERQPVPLVNKCPVCSNRISKKDIYCAECGHQLKDNSYFSENSNPILAKLFMTEDKAGNLRYSISKTFGFVILMFFIIADIIILLFGIPSTKFHYVILITFGGLFYYVLFRLAGIIHRKLSK